MSQKANNHGGCHKAKGRGSFQLPATNTETEEGITTTTKLMNRKLQLPGGRR